MKDYYVLSFYKPAADLFACVSFHLGPSHGYRRWSWGNEQMEQLNKQKYSVGAPASSSSVKGNMICKYSIIC